MDRQATDTDVAVLIVEDDPGIACLIAELLESDLGALITVAADGESGLELARGVMPDVILLDINLPRLSGLEVARQLKASPRTRSIPIIAMTASPEESCLEAGCDDYIGKPFELLDLTNTVTASLHRFSPPAARKAA